MDVEYIQPQIIGGSKWACTACGFQPSLITHDGLNIDGKPYCMLCGTKILHNRDMKKYYEITENYVDVTFEVWIETGAVLEVNNKKLILMPSLIHALYNDRIFIGKILDKFYDINVFELLRSDINYLHSIDYRRIKNYVDVAVILPDPDKYLGPNWRKVREFFGRFSK